MCESEKSIKNYTKRKRERDTFFVKCLSALYTFWFNFLNNNNIIQQRQHQFSSLYAKN